MLEKINSLGIGPGGLGGTTTALAVNINTYPTHIAGLPVAVNICCHVNRHVVREILSLIHIQINENQLKVVSLDGHRVSIRNIQLNSSYDYKKVVVPGKTLQEISKIIPGTTDENVDIFLTGNHIVFEFNRTTVVSRLIEGEYLRIEQMLSSDYETKIKINKRELLSCIDRATLLVKEGDKKPIIMKDVYKRQLISKCFFNRI